MTISTTIDYGIRHVTIDEFTNVYEEGRQFTNAALGCFPTEKFFMKTGSYPVDDESKYEEEHGLPLVDAVTPIMSPPFYYDENVCILEGIGELNPLVGSSSDMTRQFISEMRSGLDEYVETGKLGRNEILSGDGKMAFIGYCDVRSTEDEYSNVGLDYPHAEFAFMCSFSPRAASIMEPNTCSPTGQGHFDLSDTDASPGTIIDETLQGMDIDGIDFEPMTDDRYDEVVEVLWGDE